MYRVARTPNVLSADEYNRLKDFVCSHDADKYGIPYEQRVREFEKYDNSMYDSNHRPYAKLYPSLHSLPKALSIAGMGIKDVYNDVWDTPLRWPDEQSERVASTIDAMCEDSENMPFINQLCSTIRSYIASWWDTEEWTSSNITGRVKFCYKKIFALDERASLPSDVQSIMERLVLKSNSITALELPRICEVFHVSFHWLVGYPSSVLVLGKNPITEEFMDVYMRLSQGHRDHFEALILKAPEFITKQVKA